MHADGDETKTPPKKQLPLNLKFETAPIEKVSKHRLLGVTVDEQLKWQTHINICKTVSRNIFLLSKQPNCQPKIQISLLLCTYELCFKCMGWMCWCAHEAAVFSPQTCRKILDTNSLFRLQRKVLCSQTTPFRQTTIAQQMCSNANGRSRQSPAVSERSHDSI